jgi:hypothetical protein
MCGCRKGLAAANQRILPDNSTWGPPLWGILHTAAEKSSPTRDNKATWIDIFAYLPTVILCTDCKAHYATYISANPYSPPSDNASVREYTRTWLWNFHNAVNVRLGKPTYSFESLAGEYGTKNIMDYSSQYSKILTEFRQSDVFISNYKWNAFMDKIKRVIRS